MEGGIFLLLCLLALFIGSRARNNRSKQLSEKEFKRKEKIMRFMIYASLLLIVLFLLAYTPFAIREFNIARDTHFSAESYLSFGLWGFGLFTLYTIVQTLRKK